MEEAFSMGNYLKKVKKQKGDTGVGMSVTMRSYGIQKIFDLHFKKEYKEETLFIAASIFDRYINIIGVGNFNKNLTIHLATISVLMSAKLEQPISPSFTRMINLLAPEEKKNVTKPSLIEIEQDILVKLGFDFNFPGPIQTLERFLRLVNYDLNRTVFDMGFQICKFQLNDARFLDYRPSQIAACSMILSINIFEEDNQKNNPTFFKKPKNGKKELNTDIWNNEDVTSISGYSINDLKDCLFDLSEFISTMLSPNRLESFDLDAIKKLEPFNEIPNNLGLNLKNL